MAPPSPSTSAAANARSSRRVAKRQRDSGGAADRSRSRSPARKSQRVGLPKLPIKIKATPKAINDYNTLLSDPDSWEPTPFVFFEILARNIRGDTPDAIKGRRFPALATVVIGDKETDLVIDFASVMDIDENEVRARIQRLASNDILDDGQATALLEKWQAETSEIAAAYANESEDELNE